MWAITSSTGRSSLRLHTCSIDSFGENPQLLQPPMWYLAKSARWAPGNSFRTSPIVVRAERVGGSVPVMNKDVGILGSMTVKVPRFSNGKRDNWRHVQDEKIFQSSAIPFSRVGGLDGRFMQLTICVDHENSWRSPWELRGDFRFA